MTGPWMPGPYGTNPGDTWLADDWLQQRIQAREGPDAYFIIEVFAEDDGTPEERVYWTKLPELVEKAKKGHEKYIAEQAKQN